MADGPGNVVDRPQGIGGRADGQYLGSMLVQAAIQIIPVELTGLGNHPGLADGDSPLPLECSPRVDVGVVVQLGHDDRVALSQPSANRPADAKRQRGHVRTEDDLVGHGTEEIGEHLP